MEHTGYHPTMPWQPPTTPWQPPKNHPKHPANALATTQNTQSCFIYATPAALAYFHSPWRSCRRSGRPGYGRLLPLLKRMRVWVLMEGLWVESSVCVVVSAAGWVPAAAGERGGPEDTGAAGGDHETGPQSPPSGEETGATETQIKIMFDWQWIFQ